MGSPVISQMEGIREAKIRRIMPTVRIRSELYLLHFSLKEFFYLWYGEFFLCRANPVPPAK